MRIALADGHTWYHLISGQDYPIRSNVYIDRFFADTQYNAFLSFVPKAQYAEIEEMRLNRYHLCDVFNLHHNLFGQACSRIFCKLQDVARSLGIQLRQPLGMKVYKGANWFSFNNEVVLYIINYLNLHPTYEHRFRYTSCCDEVFFHTLLMNSPLAPSVFPDDLRYTRWEGKSSPEWLDERDYVSMMALHKLFCRKIHPEISKKLIEKLKSNEQP